MTNPSAAQNQATPDAIPNSWVDRAPDTVKPYLRLMRADRPIGVWLLLIPCWWGLALGNLALANAGSAGGLIALWHGVLFVIGAYVMRAAGCTYNDIVDQDIDAKVERTALRPIPAGAVSVKQAWMLLVALSLIGLVVLLQFNRTAIITGLSALALVAAYPFMKRITYWPQAWLGLTFNWGALVGFAAANGALRPEAFAIYAAGFFWTLSYDTIYAHMDKDDDILIGVKSAALKLGANTKPWIGVFVSIALILFGLAGVLIGASLAFFIGLLPAAAHFFWQWRKLDINDGHKCLTLFKSNRDAGLLLLLAPLCELAARLI
ncbi:4-hydroxybenzoate octaprenyltransferase [Hyphococcus flavus]|uniref:4-hydroxybenzoate octaprenyltransferase n=1 Tax=Hyphococcus flavus TaxID=1866326 RepID=A0AAE9ZGF8_9PROT|nr:4-hydroxybenzoate octaprenyltransferase [Hyphococcus flavus]WDI32508.1 4-hydroxybenzoate octaprenyltransferase [Hyphococcus flavus]